MKQSAVPFFLFCICSSTAPSFSNTLSSITNPQDLQYITTLAYWSYKRSESNYKIQQIAFAHLQNSWRLWNYTAQVRLNPALHSLLPSIFDNLSSVSSDITHMLNQAQISYAAYTHALAHIPCITHTKTRDYIICMRSKARYASARAILKYMLLHADELLDTQRSIQSSLINLSSYGAGIFGKTDSTYTHASNTLWQKFIVSQAVQHNLWLAIEKARARFYKNYYTQCYTALHATTKEQKYYTTHASTHAVQSCHILPAPDIL